jgi:hypothetical protein
MNELHKMNLKELTKYCKDKNIKGYSGKNKSSLISYIENNSSKEENNSNIEKITKVNMYYSFIFIL